MLRAVVFLILFSTYAFAGQVDINVRICGVTAPYTRYNEPAHGLFGSSDNGLKDQLFRIKGHGKISETHFAGGDPNPDFIAEFISAMEFKGISLCLIGNLETIERTNRTLYYFSPRGLQMVEPSESYLALSQITGSYKVSGPSTIAPVTLSKVEHESYGRMFYIEELPALLDANLGPCHSEADIKFFPNRMDRTHLKTGLVSKCDDDLVTTTVEISRGEDSTITLKINAVRTGKNKSFSLEIKRDIAR